MDAHERIGRLRADAAGRLDHRAPWLVVAATPVGRGHLDVDGAREEIRRTLEREVGDWPAPVPLGAKAPEARPGVLTFRSSGEPAIAYHCEIHADGSVFAAILVGTQRTGPPDGTPVWVLGEGAVAWIVVAMLRLTAGFVAQAGGLGGAAVEAGILMPAAGSAQGDRAGPAAAPVEVWNHASGTYSTAGGRLARVEPVGRVVDVGECLSSDLAASARPLVVGLLRQFGIMGSRHIDSGGVLRPEHFTGHDERIRAWADAIGVPFAP